MEPERELHVVLGSGQVGPVLAQKLAARGHRVRMVSRSSAPALPGVQWARGDITDHVFAAEVVRGARAIYHCANPMRYDRWHELLPPLTRAVQQAAARSGAHLLVLDNLYMYGLPASGVISESSPEQPCSKKGELRAMLAAELRAAHARGDLQLSIARASDFFGARAARSVTFGGTFFSSLARGLPSYALGDPDQPHSYAYIPDVAEGLRVLGAQASPQGRTWLLPHAWHGSSRELASLFGQAAGRPARLWPVPDWTIRMLARFGGELSGVPEMLYQWRAPFTVDDAPFRCELGVSATPIASAVRATLQSYGIAPRPEPAALSA
jgi:nucleoside-diphosphate-sugar epimerase